MSPPITDSSVVTRDDLIQTERSLELARSEWNRAGRLKVTFSEVLDAESRVQRLTEDWIRIEQAGLPLDQLSLYLAEAKSARRRLRRLTFARVWLRFRNFYWSYVGFLQRTFAIENHQLWVVCLINGVWGVATAGLVAIALGGGSGAFGVLAALGYLVTALCSVRPILAVSRSGVPRVLADLDHRRIELRTRVSEASTHYSQLAELCSALKRALAARLNLEHASAQFAELRSNAVCQAEFERVAGELVRLKRILGEERYALLTTDWQSLEGIPFEHFLARVFKQLGFRVQLTKTTGDQGVDLIVSRSDLRIAVQAKRYTNTVGNDAVQQAYAGMTFYGCNECVVITNSRFTSSAEELAKRVGCRLIAGADIPALINGHVL